MEKRGNKEKKYKKIENLLLENFANLQKVLINTTQKLEDLTLQISKLLQLFELAAKSFIGKVDEKVSEIEKDREFLMKLNALLEQNKLIAKGLTLMEEQLREKIYSSYSQQPRTQFPVQSPMQKQQPSQQENKVNFTPYTTYSSQSFEYIPEEKKINKFSKEI
ncbi:MAG: hypothetical protein QW117_03385 [Candidatus Pacearchaeota archaeon]